MYNPTIIVKHTIAIPIKTITPVFVPPLLSLVDAPTCGGSSVEIGMLTMTEGFGVSGKLGTTVASGRCGCEMGFCVAGNGNI